MEPNREEYVRQVLGAYRQTPGTTGSVRREDRLLATQLHQRQVPLRVVENALVLAAARRLLRPAHALPLGTIRSLAYHAASGIMPTALSNGFTLARGCATELAAARLAA